MKTLTIILLTSLFVLPSSYGGEDGKLHSVKREGGFVPNENTAIQIAIAVWTPIYGEDNIKKQKPFNAKLQDGIWHVSGSIPKNTKGGVAIAEIQQMDAKIIRISHGK